MWQQETGQRSRLSAGWAIGWLAAMALLPAPVACFGRTAPPPASASTQRFTSDALAQQTGLEASVWRYLPLASGAPPTREAFDRIARSCLARHPDASSSNADDLESADPEGSKTEQRQHALLFCMTQRGFYPSLCNDGRDNDSDGLIDYPQDPGCAEPSAITENPTCDDGRDNDGDGLIDWDGAGLAHPDPDCKDAAATDGEVRHEPQS